MWLRWWVSSAALLVALSDVYAAGAPAADMPGLSLIPTDISNACYTPVSYTHLTLPTKA
mgnify:CR=1 FL=1